MLIAFALSKFFDAQFQVYHYAGHILLKDVSPFTHAWSFFGHSYNYNLFLGIAEFLAGALLLFKKTRLIGLWTALAMFANILIIDIEFEVKEALAHVIVECVIVLWLLIPYARDLKKYFRDLSGKFETTDSESRPLFSIYLPLAFLVLATGGFVWELSSALKGQDEILGEYELNGIMINADTLDIEGGKYTREPMIFFEFGNTFILSIHDSTYWGDYSIQGDSIRMVLDKEIHHVKDLQGTIDRKAGVISGRTGHNDSMTLEFERVMVN